jgi:hypothetical protein
MHHYRGCPHRQQASTEPTPDKVLNPVPATPSRETERPAGLAFDVEQGANLPGVPAPKEEQAGPGTPTVSTAIGARGLRYGQNWRWIKRKKEGFACSRLPISGSGGATA